MKNNIQTLQLNKKRNRRLIMNCLFFSSISNHKFNAEEVIASSLLKTVRNRLDLVVVTGLEPRRRGLRISCARAHNIPVCACSQSLRRSSFPQKVFSDFSGSRSIRGHRFCVNHYKQTRQTKMSALFVALTRRLYNLQCSLFFKEKRCIIHFQIYYWR